MNQRHVAQRAAARVEQRVWIQTAKHRLEGLLNCPDAGDPSSGMLVLSPHPRYGGDLDNNVTRALAATAAFRGHAALRFNYHGVGNSSSPTGNALGDFRYWSRVLENDVYGDVLDDARSALVWFRELLDRPVHVVGYSFGAVLALRLASEALPIRTAAAISLAAGEYRMDFLESVRVPVFALHSDADFATPIEDVVSLLARIDAPVRFHALGGTDHFLRGRESDVASVVCDFLSPRAPERQSR